MNFFFGFEAASSFGFGVEAELSRQRTVTHIHMAVCPETACHVPGGHVTMVIVRNL